MDGTPMISPGPRVKYQYRTEVSIPILPKLPAPYSITSDFGGGHKP